MKSCCWSKLDTNGYKRLIGRQLWDYLTLITQLLTYYQCLKVSGRFVIAMMQDLGNPEKEIKNTILFF
jgi:hypothetical protein